MENLLEPDDIDDATDAAQFMKKAEPYGRRFNIEAEMSSIHFAFRHSSPYIEGRFRFEVDLHSGNIWLKQRVEDGWKDLYTKKSRL